MSLLNWLFGPPSPAKFAKMVVQALRDAGEQQPIRFVPDEFMLVVGDQKTGSRKFLANIYKEYCAVPHNVRAAMLQAYVNMKPETDIPALFEEAAPHLLPRIRERAYYELTSLHVRLLGSVMPKRPYRVIGEHLAVSLAYDLPDQIVEMNEDKLSQWCKSLEESLEVAGRNLAAISRQAFDSPRDGVYVSPWKDNHDASRLYLQDKIAQLRVKGKHVATVPHRDSLIITGSEDVPGLEMLADLTEKALEGPRPMLGIPMVLQEGKWTPFQLPAEHPLHKRFRQLWFMSRSRDYTEQKELLDKLHEKTKEDIFVANYSVMQNEDTGEAASFCVLTEGALSLLPKTDKIAFMVGAPKNPELAGLADWDKIKREFSHLLVPVEMYPERYRVEKFPDIDRLKPLLTAV